MKLTKSLFAAIAATLLIAISMQAKNEMKRIYIFGFASSFNDSIVCFTDVQAVDSAWLNSKNNFLVGREDYSYQLRDFLQNEGYKHPTCMVSYDKNLKKLTKKYNKMRNKYSAQPKNTKSKSGIKEGASSKYQVKLIGMDRFVFSGIKPYDSNEETVEQKPAKKIKAKKALKQQKKKQRNAE